MKKLVERNKRNSLVTYGEMKNTPKKFIKELSSRYSIYFFTGRKVLFVKILYFHFQSFI